MSAEVRRFRFRPRYRGLALTSAGLGGTLSVVSLAALGAATLPLATGVAGLVLGTAYMLSPTWRIEVVVGDEAIEVRTRKATKLRLPWTDVVRVVAAEQSPTMFVDGGTPENSLLVPGEGAPAPYDIEDKPGLCAAILAHVPADRVTKVDSLEHAR